MPKDVYIYIIFIILGISLILVLVLFIKNKKLNKELFNLRRDMIKYDYISRRDIFRELESIKIDIDEIDKFIKLKRDGGSLKKLFDDYLESIYEE